jgi:hypothetical protein
VQIAYHSARALYGAHSAAYALLRIDHSYVIDYMHSICRTVLLTQPAGDAGVNACVSRCLAGILVAARRLDIETFCHNIDYFLRAGSGTQSASGAFSGINDCGSACSYAYGT